MLFPEQTRVNKIMPKAKFMKLAELSTTVREEIQNNVERLIISNVLNEKTIHIAKGRDVVEIDVFEIQLKLRELSDKVIKEIDSALPRNIIYILRYENKAQVVVSYKEKSTNNKYKVLKTYRTEWKNYDDFKLNISGLNLDFVFNNFLSQIAEGKLEITQDIEIKAAVEKSIDKEKLNRRIEQLQNKIRKEPQFNKQLELKKQLKSLLEELNTK